jgi:hypothetical protein
MTERRAKRSRRQTDRMRTGMTCLETVVLVVVLVWIATAFAARQDEAERAQDRLVVVVDYQAVVALETLDQLCLQARQVAETGPAFRRAFHACLQLRDHYRTTLTATQAARYEKRNPEETQP